MGICTLRRSLIRVKHLKKWTNYLGLIQRRVSQMEFVVLATLLTKLDG